MFRLTSSYKESTLSEELFKYMLVVVTLTVDDFSDKLFMISNGMLPIQELLESEQKE